MRILSSRPPAPGTGSSIPRRWVRRWRCRRWGELLSIDLSGFRARRLSPEALEKTSMHPKIVQLDGFEVSRHRSPNQQRQRGRPRRRHSEAVATRHAGTCPRSHSGQNESDLYAVYTDYASDANGDYTLVLGAKVQPGTNPSEGMIAKVVPAGRYAVFTSERGPVAKVVVETWMRIWSHYQIPPMASEPIELTSNCTISAPPIPTTRRWKSTSA